ncbi:MAG: CHAT domain-containing protein, partial [Gammaproteobacteria bacterium]|nr:CHAT domain-containing protein [Gammaproteobacteria bacterium]
PAQTLSSIDLSSEADLGVLSHSRATLPPAERGVGCPGERPSQDAPVTLENLIRHLREERPDILCLVAHGALHKKSGEALLYLQNDAGTVQVVKGADLALRLRELSELPRLAVLVSCESAGDGASDPSSALAPLLNQAGIPAVLAMQGKISMATVEKMMPVFFRELSKDGQLDRALAVARGAVRERSDAWMPALFLRLKGGRLWYEAGFGTGEADFGKWQSLVHSLARGECTPIIGSGVAEKLYGGNAWLARQLAEANQFPLAAHQLDDLPTVSQYLSLAQSPNYAREQVQQQLRRELQHNETFDAEQQKLSLPKLLKLVSERRQADPNDPHHILAELNCPLYISANPDNLLSLALSAADKKPVTVFCPWKRNPANQDELYSDRPGVSTPLVYHILGHFKEKDSLVLTEDDYFQYLIGVTLNKKLVPPVVREATVNSALLFLGFHLTDWSFRVLFRLIMSQGGRRRLDEYTHVAVQIEPEEHSSINPRQAKTYLEKYFEGHGNFSIYWGTATDFLKELRERLNNMDALPATDNEAGDDDEWE